MFPPANLPLQGLQLYAKASERSRELSERTGPPARVNLLARRSPEFTFQAVRQSDNVRPVGRAKP